MPGACGIACEVCGLRDQCGGCVAGTDPRAPQRQAELRKLMGAPCPALNCAMRKGIDYCLRCPDFPCEVHYKWEIPYSRKLLDLVKKFKARE